MIELREYQSELIQACRGEYRAGAKRVCLQLGTGGGKTVIFSFIAKSAVEKGLSVMVLAHRSEILTQIEATLAKINVPRGTIRAGEHNPVSKGVTVASIQTLIRRFERTPEPDLVIVDECHHSVTETWKKVFETYKNARFLGVTATPERMDGKGLGTLFEKMVRGPEISWLIDAGYLSRPVYYVPPVMADLSGVKIVAGDYSKSESAAILDKPSITGSARDHYLQRAKGRKFIGFCVNLQHANNACVEFNAAGIRAAVIDGKLSDTDRCQRIFDLESGALDGLMSCEILGEGVDVPAVGCIILLRPTHSLALSLQQLGRGLRPKDGDNTCIILDHVGNLERHGPAEELRAWSLEGRSARKRSKEAVLDFRRCLKCFRIFQGTVCPECGTVRASKAREIEEREGELRALEAAELIAKRQARVQVGRAQTLQELIAIGKARGYASKWAYIRWQISRKNPVNRTVVKREKLLV